MSRLTRRVGRQGVTRRVALDGLALVDRLEEITRRHPRYSDRIVRVRLRIDGQRVNPTRVHLLCLRAAARTDEML